MLSTAASGFTFPSLRVTLAFVRACGGGSPGNGSSAGKRRPPELRRRGRAAGPAPDLARPGWFPRPAQMPPACPYFAGRAAELGQLLRFTDPGHTARAGAVVITGPVGVGKTALAVAAARGQLAVPRRPAVRGSGRLPGGR